MKLFLTGLITLAAIDKTRQGQTLRGKAQDIKFRSRQLQSASVHDIAAVLSFVVVSLFEKDSIS
jgi:hypothetical protein